MEQDHNETDDGKAELDSTLPPLTKWERIEKTSEAFPLNNGHRGQIINNYLIVHGGFSGVYTNATWMLNLGKSKRNYCKNSIKSGSTLIQRIKHYLRSNNS